MNGSDSSQNGSVQRAIDVAIPLLAIGAFIFWCFRILQPFLQLVVWSAVLATALYPLVSRLAGSLGGRRKLAVALVVLIGLAILLVPVMMMAGSLIDSVTGIMDGVERNALRIPPPPEDVADWPLVGERLHKAWATASRSLETFVEAYQPQVKSVLFGAVGELGEAGVGIVFFALALLVSGLLMARAEASEHAMAGLADRITGDDLSGEELVALTVATVRAVATGVLGVACIQSVLAGMGLLFFEIPAAGFIALVVLVLAIAQLPPLLGLLPVALWYFGSADSQLSAWAFLIFCVLVNLSDLVLKPMLLGRGVAVPMPVVLLGAIGGMINAGIIGLFVGAVVLTVGYRLLMVWLGVGVEEMKEQLNGA